MACDTLDAGLLLELELVGRLWEFCTLGLGDTQGLGDTSGSNREPRRSCEKGGGVREAGRRKGEGVEISSLGGLHERRMSGKGAITTGNMLH